MINLVAIPQTKSAIKYYVKQIRNLDDDLNYKIDLWHVCQKLNIEIDIADIKSSNIEALLLPRSGGGFIIYINRIYINRIDFLIAHEIGHSLFFTHGNPPKRTIPYSFQEEKFCDDFAAALIGEPS